MSRSFKDAPKGTGLFQPSNRRQPKSKWAPMSFGLSGPPKGLRRLSQGQARSRLRDRLSRERGVAGDEVRDEDIPPPRHRHSGWWSSW